MKNQNKIIAFQMNSLDDIKLDTDTSFLIALALQYRGYRLFFYEPINLSILNGRIFASGFFANIAMKHQGDHYSVIKACNLDLGEATVVMIRQDPPFDMQYITTTYILDMLPNTTFVFNNPTSVRSLAEKVSPLFFAEFLPNYIITGKMTELELFTKRFSKIVLKPLYQHGGKDVILLARNDDNFHKQAQSHLDRFGYVIAQEYMSDVEVNGDKRILMVDGHILGFFRRIPRYGDFRSNTALGSAYEKCDLTEHEYIICQAVGKFLNAHGVLLAGLDILNDKLIEINITSPTGLVILNKLYGLKHEEKVIDAIENRFKN